jgi:VIT1/CCC1 family predicted Fe2+/Mn2+ transporter
MRKKLSLISGVCFAIASVLFMTEGSKYVLASVLLVIASIAGFVQFYLANRKNEEVEK